MPLGTWPVNSTHARVVPFKTALWAVAAEDGMIAEADGLTIQAAHQIANCITRAYKYALEFYDWPEAAIYSTFNLGLHPVTGTPFIPRAQSDGTPNIYPVIDYGRLYGVWTKHPAAFPDAREVAYRFGPDGIYLDEELPQVTLHHRRSAPRFTATEWDASRAYVRNDHVYHPETGHCYRALDPATGEVPQAKPPEAGLPWEILPILQCLLEPTVEGAFALLKRSQGQSSTADMIQGSMEHLLEQEILQFTNQESQTKFYQTALR